MSEIGAIKNNVWSYHDKSRRTMTVAASLLVVVSFLAVIILHQSSSIEFLALSLIVLLFFSLTERSASVEIDRTTATVKKVRKLFLFRQTNSYPLCNFDTVSLRNEVASVEEGYKVILYSVILKGSQASVDLFSTDDEKEGRLLQKELSEFLSLSGRSVA